MQRTSLFLVIEFATVPASVLNSCVTDLRILSGRIFHKALLHILVSSMITFLVACSGKMDGVVRGEGTRVTFEYEQGMERDFYEATIDGEHFKGQAVYAHARSDISVGSFDGTTLPVITSSTSGNLVAVMFGDRGSTMRCDMNYADSSGFTPMGGVGICWHSDGRIIDILW